MTISKQYVNKNCE